MADPIARAINTFAALRGMDLQQEQVKQGREDALYRRGMLDKQESRAAELFDLNKQAHQKTQEIADEDRGWKREDRQRDGLERERKEVDQILHARYLEAGGDESKMDLPGLLAELKPYQERGALPPKFAALFNPQRVEEKLAGTKVLVGQMSSGQFDHAAAVEAANQVFAEELDARGQKYGAKSVRINRIVPSPDGKGVMFGAQITRADGTTYEAPLTENGRTADEGDDKVKIFGLEQLVPYLASQAKVLSGVKAHLLASGKIEQPKQEWSFGADGQLRMDKHSGRVEKTGYVKPVKGAGDGEGGSGGGSGGGRGGKKGKGLSNDDYKLFDDQLNKHFLSELQALQPAEKSEMADLMESDAFGNQRVSMERAVAKMPAEMRSRYNAARQAGEHFMAEGGLTPILAANKAMQYASLPQPGQGAAQGPGAAPAVQQGDINKIAPERLSLLQQGLKNAEAAGQEEALGFLDQLRREQPAEFAALTRTLKPSGNPGPETNPKLQGMAPLRDQVFTKLNKGMQQSGWNPDYPVELVGKGLSALWQVAPARLAAVGVADALKDFQQWSRNRYNTPGAERSAQALAEYAKENPQAAEQIARAAAQAAQ